MKKSVKIFIGVAVAVVILVVVFVLVKKANQKRAAALVPGGATGGTSGGSSSGGSGGTTINVGGNNTTPPATVRQPSKTFLDLPQGTFPVKKGQKSKLVYMLQRYINVRFGQNLVEDGSYGDKTEEAAKKTLGKTSFDAAWAKQAYAGIPPAKYKEFEDLASWLKSMQIITWG